MKHPKIIQFQSVECDDHLIILKDDGSLWHGYWDDQIGKQVWFEIYTREDSFTKCK